MWKRPTKYSMDIPSFPQNLTSVRICKVVKAIFPKFGKYFYSMPENVRAHHTAYLLLSLYTFSSRVPLGTSGIGKTFVRQQFGAAGRWIATSWSKRSKPELWRKFSISYQVCRSSVSSVQNLIQFVGFELLMNRVHRASDALLIESQLWVLLRLSGSSRIPWIAGLRSLQLWANTSDIHTLQVRLFG